MFINKLKVHSSLQIYYFLRKKYYFCRKFYTNSDLIKATASAIGFDMCGVVRCQKFAAEGEFLKQWIADGKVSNLSYLQRNIDKRTDATLLVKGAKSVIVCGVSYKNRYSEGYKDCNQKIASYALTTDYHITIKQMF